MDQPFTAVTSPSLPTEDVLLQHSYDQLQMGVIVGLLATWVWDIGNDKVYGDQKLYQLAGLQESDQKVGLSLTAFLDHIHSEDRPRIRQLMQETLHSGTVYEAKYRIRKEGQETKWVLARGYLSYDDQSQPLTLSGVLIDQAKQQQAEIRSQLTKDQLRLAVESAQLGTWNYKPLTNELIWSDRCKELFGLPITTQVDYGIFLKGLHPEDRERTDRIVQDALRPGSNGRYDIEYRVIGINDNKLRWIRANGQAYFNEKGVASQLIGTVIDITDSKQAEIILHQRVTEQTQDIERQAQQLRTILDASLNSIIAMTSMRDHTGAIVDFRMDAANESVIKRSNFKTLDQVIGQTLLTVFPGTKQNGFFDLYRRVADTGKAEQDTQHYQDEFGLEGWYEVSVVKQEPDGVVVTYNNITDRKRADLAMEQQAAELRATNAELKRSNESLQQFAHIASHDLQEPLRRIQNFSDMLRSQFIDNLSDGEMDMIERIQKSGRRMQLLIKDLLLYSHLTQLDAFTEVQLTDVLDDVVNDLELIITEKKATITVSALPQIVGSASRLRQLFQNLITNALKFCRPDVLPVIDIRYRVALLNELPVQLRDKTDQSFWIITIADNGIGFDERYKDRIFSPFQRLHSTKTYSGTGIGLAICQRVAESHGGAIDVSSQEGKGATFKLFLPISKAA